VCIPASDTPDTGDGRRHRSPPDHVPNHPTHGITAVSVDQHDESMAHLNINAARPARSACRRPAPGVRLAAAKIAPLADIFRAAFRSPGGTIEARPSRPPEPAPGPHRETAMNDHSARAAEMRAFRADHPDTVEWMLRQPGMAWLAGALDELDDRPEALETRPDVPPAFYRDPPTE
jgi:hypothetical protein